MRYWTGSHAPLVKRTVAGRDHVRRYINNVGVPLEWKPGEGVTLPYDGVVQASLNGDLSELRNAAETVSVVIEDEPNFLSERPGMVPVEPVTIKPFAGTFRSKVLLFWKRRPDLLLADAERIWLETHAPEEARIWGAELIGYIANRCLPFGWTRWGDEMPRHDGVSEYYFDIAPEDLPARWSEVAQALGEGTRRFAADIRMMCVREVVQIGDGPGPG
jgi:hypothetical protein